MDPVATLRALRDAINAGEWTNAVEALNNYYRWRLRGGFEPSVPWLSGIRGDVYADTLANNLQDRLEELS